MTVMLILSLIFLDPKNKYFEYRLYRKNCVLCDIYEMKFYVKDLKIIEDAYDLKDVVVIDNSVLSFAYHLDNDIPISPFYDSKTDKYIFNYFFGYYKLKIQRKINNSS